LTQWAIEIHEGANGGNQSFRVVADVVGCDPEAHLALEGATRLGNHEGLPQDVRCSLLGSPSRFAPALESEAEYWGLIHLLSASIQQLGDIASLRRLLTRLNRTEDRTAIEAIRALQQLTIEPEFTTIKQEPCRVFHARFAITVTRSLPYAYWQLFFDVLRDFLLFYIPLNAELTLDVLDLASGESLMSWASAREKTGP
jgi:hypothetical protein